MLIEIQGLPPMANGGHGSWQKSHGIRKAWKTRVGNMLLGKVPRTPYQLIHVIFTRHSSSEPDYDGLVHGFKPVRDALVNFGIVIDDDSTHMRSEYRWCKAKAKEGKITIEITPITE